MGSTGGCRKVKERCLDEARTGSGDWQGAELAGWPTESRRNLGRTGIPGALGLGADGVSGDPSGTYKRKYEGNIKKGYDQLVKYAKPDGGIYAEKLPNYNTSISLMALVVANNLGYEPVMKKARNFLVGLQDNLGDDVAVNRGIGYGGRYKHSDLNNTLNSLEALHYTRFLKSDVANDPEAKELNWKAAIQFVSRTQNLPGSNDQKWASDDPANKGGFVYFPATAWLANKSWMVTRWRFALMAA